MRILVELNELRNSGDLAMLEVAVTRLCTLWPDALIQVLSEAPASLPTYGLNVAALDAGGRRLWYSHGMLLGRFALKLSPTRYRQMVRLEQWLRRQHPDLAAAWLRARFRRTGRLDKLVALESFLDSVAHADLVIASGMGGITDVFPEYASELLDTLALARRWGAVTAMMGQGMGPLQEPTLRRRAQEVLRNVDFIALREERSGGPLLKELGVPAARVMTTGDDAIELAYQTRAESLGTGLGINMRAATYAGVDGEYVERVRQVVQTSAQEYATQLVPVPISRVPGESDLETIQQLTTGYPAIVESSSALDSPSRVIEQIQHCRVVVAGSYHAAVLALAQGISVVGLANSPYYRDKFQGLAAQFGEGCHIVFLADTDSASNLRSAIDAAWRSAETARAGVLDAAARQVMLSHQAYQRVFDEVTNKRMKMENGMRPTGNVQDMARMRLGERL